MQVVMNTSAMFYLDDSKPTVIALREVAAGRIGIEMLDKMPS